MTAEEVRALPIGVTIKAIKEGHEPILCTVSYRGSPVNKFLTYREKGQIKKFAIRDYPDLRFRKGEDTNE